jgi:hypothetical protein
MRSALSPPRHDGSQSAIGDATILPGGDIEVGSACRMVADCYDMEDIRIFQGQLVTIGKSWRAS